MTQATPRSRRSPAGTRARSRRPRRSAENSDVLIPFASIDPWKGKMGVREA